VKEFCDSMGEASEGATVPSLKLALRETIELEEITMQCPRCNHTWLTVSETFSLTEWRKDASSGGWLREWSNPRRARDATNLKAAFIYTDGVWTVWPPRGGSYRPDLFTDSIGHGKKDSLEKAKEAADAVLNRFISDCE
jgi:hypothetical protein